jgi:ubiquitin-conjugating enzyme E2 Z
LFLIKIIFPSDYPFSAPKCKLLTTGGGTVRFGPNLYACGKICLSILGTWDGPGWAPNLSLAAVLVSIQSLMSQDAAQNEPGHEKASKKEIDGLNNVLRHEVLRVAVLDQMKSVLNKKFYDDDICEAMLDHFRSSYQTYIEHAKKYVHLDGTPFSDPYYARVTDSGRIFRFKLLVDEIEEQSKLLKQESVVFGAIGETSAQLPPNT